MNTADDAVHSNDSLGIKSKNITINGGEIMIDSTDDGINGAGGNGEFFKQKGKDLPVADIAVDKG